MAKSASKKKSSSTSNTSSAKKTNGQSKPANDIPSKLKPTHEANNDVMELDASGGLMKLFTDCLKDIYWAENHLIKALPKMAKATSIKKLQTDLLNHLEQTKTHAERLEEVFELLGKEPQARKCEAMEGLTKEGEAVIENTATGTPARNLGIIMASQKVEHYEISSYTGLIKLAENLGYGKISGILEETLNEEEDSDALLSEVATSEILNPEKDNDKE